MPYPFIHCPTWAVMRDDLIKKYGVEEYAIPTAPDLRFLRRKVEKVVVEMPFALEFRDDETLSVSAIREICEYLRLPKSKFGWTMDQDEDAL